MESVHLRYEKTQCFIPVSYTYSPFSPRSNFWS